MPAASEVEIAAPPSGLEEQHAAVFTADAIAFLLDCYTRFRNDIQTLYDERCRRQLALNTSGELPMVSSQSARTDGDWTVAPLPDGLKDRRIDLGDVTPSDMTQLTAALNSTASGVQVDFDDGHCPTWRNQLLGWHHVMLASTGDMEMPPLEQAPVLMLRPRAWNMTEYNVLIGGRPMPGALTDYCLLLFHCGRKLAAAGRGPALYLPKLEAVLEARLWNSIFCWTEDRLQMDRGTIRAVLMIENVLAACEIEDMLYELREHSLGLNCGMWDYAASFISKFSRRPEFVLPDRGTNITMAAPFLTAYLRHALSVGRRRKALVTAGMAPQVLPEDIELRNSIITSVVLAKRAEIEEGVDGFLAHDPKMIPALHQLWEVVHPGPEVAPDLSQLLAVPKGHITTGGIHENVCVSLMFIHAWLDGQGQFVHRGRMEDSATAEISRSQLWQWCRHRVPLHDSHGPVTLELVFTEIESAVNLLKKAGTDVSDAAPLLKSLIRSEEFIPFITTFLSQLPVVQDAP
ncbi:malate synthase-like [Amphibalanus amphitrite]|uniref:malate synthase-like n=1 Tax=Amphibalanus amphitrite TaxID=1232801 RepID=UPI001C8FEC80|nr:malate synthase-like [Amphibalanus amphitrite]